MYHEIIMQLLKERELNVAFNMGLQCAVFVLEQAERLSPEGRRHLLESLKKNIAQSEGVYTLRVLECISGNF